MIKKVLSITLLITPALLFAQSTGTILGTVGDTSGAVVPDAAIKVISLSTSQQWQTTSDSSGRFSFPRLPVGDYRMEAAHTGFRQFVSEGIHLDSDQTR